MVEAGEVKDYGAAVQKMMEDQDEMEHVKEVYDDLKE